MLLSHPRSAVVYQMAQEEINYLRANNFALDEVTAVQIRKLERLWQRAATTPYYGSLFHDKSVRFQSLPLTPKSLVKQQPEQLFAFNGASPPIKYYETSGTTGIPTPTPRLVEDIIWNTISLASAWGRVIEPRSRVAILLPSDLSPIGDTISYVCEYLDVCLTRCYPFTVGISDWDRLQNLFLRYRPTCLFAAPGVLLQFMRVLKKREKFAALKESISQIMLLGEVSTPSLRQMLARNWAAQVYDASYGSTETGTIAATCTEGQLHVLSYSFILELFAAGQICPLAAGRQGELVVTALNNYARPLLRYNTGDIVNVVDGATCACSLRLPILKILGRKEEIIQVNDSPIDVELLENVIYAIPGITGYMIEMKQDGRQVRLLLEKDIDFPADSQAQIIMELETRFAAHHIIWDGLVLLNQLPAITKSGAGQKNWKKTNVRMVA